MKKFKIIPIVLIVISIVFLSVFSCYKMRNVLKFQINSYTKTNIKNDILAWTNCEFDLSEDVVLDIIENPSSYYLVVFYGEIYNHHFYNLYNWYVVENDPLSDVNDYWIDSSHIEGTYALKPFSKHSHNAYILVKCDETEIEGLCQKIISKQLLICKGTTKEQDGGRFYVSS